MPAQDRTVALRRRLVAHDLLAPADGSDDVLALRTGLQDAGPGTALAAMAVRLGSARPVLEVLADGSLAVAMSLRGTPHLHRTADLPELRAAMVPSGRGDLEAVCGPVPDAVAAREDPVGEVAAVLAEVVAAADGPVRKADLSGAATPRLPAALTPHCASCGVRHPVDGLFRLATLRAGLVLVPGERTQTFRPLDALAGRPVPSAAGTREARRALLRTARRLADPLDPDQTATWFGWAPATVRDLGGADGPADEAADAAGEAVDGAARRTRLLPARDPWLRGADRAWLIGGRTDRRGEVFRSLHAPGVVLRDGEVVGTWRQRAMGRRLRCEVDAWVQLTAADRRSLEQDAGVVAAVRGLASDLQVG